MRSTEEAIKEDIKDLRERICDEEKYNRFFDAILEGRLNELDPKFMKAMTKEYDESGIDRYCEY